MIASCPPRPARRFARWAGLAASAAALTSAVVGCVPLSATKAGAGAVPITLTLATPEAAGTPYAPLLEDFAARVERATEGAVEVRIVWQLIPWAPHSEGELVELVRDGGVDLAVIPSRAFDLAGIDDLEALQAPFVIDDAVQAADAIDLPAVTEALARLEGAGVAALGIALEGMRRPAAYDPDAPLLAASDFAGLGIRVPASHASEALFATLGAVPGLSDSVMRAADGTLLSAAETGYAWTGTLTDEPVITANMAFFPKYDLLVGSVERLEALDDDQRAALEAAARDAAGAFTAAMTDETAAAADFCTAGGSLAFASDEQLAGVRAAAQPALAALRERPQTAALIDAITAADTGATPALDIPRECLPPLGDGAGWPSP